MRRDARQSLEGRARARRRCPCTLTKTLAWRRSRVTSQPVTVTSPMIRGSFTSVREERRDFLADGLRHAVGAAMLSSHRPAQADATVDSSVRATSSVR